MPLPLMFPVLLLLIQGVLLTLPPAISSPAAYIAMVAAPLLAAVAVALRGRADVSAARAGWYALAASLVIWALGAFGNLWQEWVAGHSNEMYRGSTLAFNLAGVPIAFVLAGEWRTSSRRQARSTARSSRSPSPCSVASHLPGRARVWPAGRGRGWFVWCAVPARSWWPVRC